MPDIDTSPEAMRALANKLNPSCGMISIDHDHQTAIAKALRALAAEKEAAQASELSGISGDIPADQDATVNPNLTGCLSEVVKSTQAPDFIAELQGFATMCERSLSIGDGPMLAATFRDAAFCISIAAKQGAEDLALIRTLRANLAGAEEARDQAVALAEADKVEITAWRTRALRAEAERDAASAHASGGVAAIAAERRRQTEVEGWTIEHDDAHGRGDMPRAAACYAWVASLGGSVRELTAHFDTWHELPVFRTLWPWDRKWWKPTDPRRDLVKAGALIAAEIDRLDRAALAEQEAGE